MLNKFRRSRPSGRAKTRCGHSYEPLENRNLLCGISGVGPSAFGATQSLVHDSASLGPVPSNAEAAASDFVVVNTNDSGAGSLRAAIESANSTAGTQTITFDLPQHSTISLLSALPAITETVNLDASTVTGYSDQPLVNLDGSSAGIGVDGLSIQDQNTTVRGLAFVGFGGDGIDVFQADLVSISETFVGIRSDAGKLGNGEHGIRIRDSRSAVIIDSVISENTLDGIFASDFSSDARITNNHIGTDSAGTDAAGNGLNGITLLSEFNFVQNNVIADNGLHGISINKKTGIGNTVAGNKIGVDINGDALGNDNFGILAISSDNVIGGDLASDGNVIGSNGRHGVILRRADRTVIENNLIGINESNQTRGNAVGGVRVLGSSFLYVGSNTISANAGAGLFLGGVLTDNAVIEFNRIGTDSTGQIDLGNSGPGLIQNGAINGRISANTISGNDAGGVFSVGGDLFNAYLSNNIGVAADGLSRLDNTGAAMYMVSGSNIIGGDDGVGNRFSSDLVSIVLRTQSGNEVSYNYIGTDATFTANHSHRFGLNIVAGGSLNFVYTNTFGNVDVAIQNRNGGNGNTFVENTMMNVNTGIDNGTLGLQANDANDADEGPNRLQNSPTLGTLQLTGQSLGIQFRVDSSSSNAEYAITVDFYLEGNDRVGLGFLGMATFTETDFLSGSFANATLDVGAFINVGDRIVATATDLDGNTSEFGFAGTVT